MKKLICVILVMLFSFSILSGCEIEPVERPEQPHLYWKDINVVVEEVDKHHYFATVHHYEVSVTVYSKEYNLRETLDLYSKGIKPEYWDIEEGDAVKAELYSWVMDSTGEVVKRQINSLN